MKTPNGTATFMSKKKKLFQGFGAVIAVLLALAACDYHDYGWRIGSLCVADRITWFEFSDAFVVHSNASANSAKALGRAP